MHSADRPNYLPENSIPDLGRRFRISTNNISPGQAIVIVISAVMLLIDTFRLAILPARHYLAFTDGFELIAVAMGALAAGFAAARSTRLPRTIWIMTATYLVFNVVADTHDLLADLGWQMAVLHPLEWLGWCTYLPLALLIFCPLMEEGQLRWKWLPVIDFAQAGLAIGVAGFRYVYIRHMISGQTWMEFGAPELVRNVLIAAGLLLRARYEPWPEAKRIYRVIGLAFAAITVAKIITPSYDAAPAALVRHASLLFIAVFAAGWQERPFQEMRTDRRRRGVHRGLTVLAATMFASVLLIADDEPPAYSHVVDVVAAVSLALFTIRTIVGDRERDVTRKAWREGNERLQAMFNHQVVGMMITSPEELWIDVNETWCRMIGYTRDELQKLDWSAIIYRDDVAHHHDNVSRICRGEAEHCSSELRFVRKDDTVLYTQFSLSCVRFPDGTPRYFLGLASDISERKRAEESLRESEDRYRDLFEHSEDLVCTHNLEGRLLSVNPAATRSLGYTTEELLNTPMQEMLAPEYRNFFKCYLQEITSTGCGKGLLCVMTKDGKRRIWEYNCTLRTEGVAVPIVRGMAHDVTERKMAEDALRYSEERYRNFVCHATEGIFRQDLDAPIPVDQPEDQLVQQILHDSYMAECNQAMMKMYGLNSIREFIGRRLTEFLDPEDERNIELTREYIRSGFRILERESHETDIHGNPKVFRNSLIGIVKGGKLLQTWGIQRDVTEQVRLEKQRQHAQQALSESEERFRVALNSSPISVFNQDAELRYTWIYNPQLYWQQEDILGKTDEELLGVKKAAALTALKTKVLSTGVAVREEVVVSQNGKSFVFDMTIEPLHDSGKIVGITGACVDIARLHELAERLQAAKDKLTQEKSYLENEIQTELGFEEIIGQSPQLREVLRKARIVAPTDSTVLLLGETGTGKELVARSVHALSDRNGKNFVKLNCAAVPSGLLESELFGHEKGAYTSAVSQKIGRIELADKGTLFLDEIGELPLELQPKLLRVLQDREFERLGGVRTLHVDVRIIAATNRDLREDIGEKRFREDLFYRLNVFPIELPPLRERPGDVAKLVHHFVAKHSARMGKHITVIPEQTARVLESWNWPGNVRELENVVERMVIMSKGAILAAPPAELQTPSDSALDNLTEMEREHIIRVLRETNGVLSGADGAANRLGLKRTTLQSMLKRFNIQANEYRRGSYN